jgi:hypothetical protein
VILLAASLLAMQAAPAAASQPWDSGKLLHVGGDTWLLERAIDETLFESPAMRVNLQRIGLPATCAIASGARKAALTREAARFRAALVATMRAMIPAERLAGEAYPAFTTLREYERRVSDALANNSASGMARARDAVLNRFEREAVAAPATTRPWADMFADWDLNRSAAVRAACNQYKLVDPAKGKQLLDVFYQRKEVH